MNETKLEPIDDELVQTYKKACAIFKNDMRKTFLGFKWKYYKKTFTAEDITIE
jgi:hypothetical protein